VAEPIRVVPEDLRVSACTVESDAEELQVRRTSAAARIEAANAGVPAGAAAALSAAVAKWRMDTDRHFSALSDHSTGLGRSAAAYRKTEEGNARSVTSVGRDG
jgi:uncharacterized protein YukE